jgi:hypothetical protein
MVHDRYQNYDAIPSLVHQLCAQHIVRDLAGAAETYPDAHWPVQIREALRGLIHAASTRPRPGPSRRPRRGGRAPDPRVQARRLTAATIGQPEPDPEEDQINAKIAECDRKLARCRATLDAGADPATVARWITETEAEGATYQAIERATPQSHAPSMSRDEISSVVTALSDLLAVLRAADPADKAEIYSQLGLRLTYQPSDDPAIQAEVRIAPAQHWQFEGVRGGT